MMKDVDAMLRRIDQEIVQHRQEIAGRQVAIARLEDSRKVLQGLAEGDQIAAEMAKAERVSAPGQINGHARPMLIVRRTGSGDEEPKPPGKKAKVRDYERERAKAEELRQKREKGEVPAPRKRSSPVPRETLKYDTADRWGGGKALQDKIAALVAKTGPIASREIGNRMGFEHGSVHRQPLSNALWQLKKDNRLHRDESNLYSVVRQ